MRIPKVSVVVPNYNHARFLRRRVDSILAQTFQDFELILLDDCSTDDSRSILSEYAGDSRIRIEFNETNSGSPFKQWNKGVRLARGEYVWIAESDDFADVSFLESLCGALDSEPGAAFAYCRSWRIFDDDHVDGFADPPCSDERNPDRWTRNYCADGMELCKQFIDCNIVQNASAVLFRRAVYHQVGGADERFRLCGDWKLWTAMALSGQLVYLAEPINYYRFHDATVRSATSEDGTNVPETFQVRWWILDKVTRAQLYSSNSELRVELLKSCMQHAFQCYPDFPDLSRLALERVRELGGTDYTPPFGSWRGELLKRTIGWKATRRANLLYYRFLKAARSAMCRQSVASKV
jgi:glycosyltransferase involved in cell wall biosynthesis